MNWIGGFYKKSLEQLYSGDWVIRYSKHIKTLKNDEGESYEITRWVEKIFPKKPTLFEVKDSIIKSLEEYDSSDDVNNIIVNGVGNCWITKDTRVGLRNSIQYEIEAGKETTELWVNSMNLVIPCLIGLELLKSIELYALDCYRVTQTHLRNIQNLQDIESLLNYNFTEGYPEQLQISF